MRRTIGALTIAPLALILAACGSDDAVREGAAAPSSASAATGQVAGAGASSQESAMKAWVANYQSANPDATVAYDPVGSGAGIEQFLSGRAAFAGSDAPLEGDEIAAAGKRCAAGALNLPMYVSPVAVVFNLPGIDELNMAPQTLAGVFTGEITTWTDPRIATDNPGVELPDVPITPVHRADKSGTTENFTDYLHAAAPEGWPHEADKAWPISGGESGDKTAGLIDVVTRANGAIGYADASQAGSLGTVALAAGDSFASVTQQSAAAAVDAAQPGEGASEHNLPLVLDRVPDSADQYPLVQVSYEIVCASYPDAQTAELVASFLTYTASIEGQQVASEAAGSVPLSPEMSAKVTRAIESIQAG